MTVVREAICALVEERFAALPGVTEVERMPSGDPMSFNALHIFDDGQQPRDGQAQASEYELGLTIVGYVEGNSGATAHGELNALYAAVVTTLLTDPPLGGLAETIDEGPMRIDVASLASDSRLAFTLDIIVGFSTKRGRPAEEA